MTENFSIQPAEGTWVVRAGGAVLGESERALEVTAGSEAPVIYFPREDIAMEFLDPSDRKETSAMGEAAYFSIVTKSTTLEDAAWSYETPTDGYGEMAGRLAFHEGDLVAVERV